MDSSNAVVVVGSANLDVVVDVPREPSFGETILGSEVTHLPGGKGLNQACASGSTGVQTFFIGAVGDDPQGKILLQRLEDHDVDTQGVEILEGKLSGSAHILVSATGSNQIVVVPAANGKVKAETVSAELAKVPQTKVLVLQGEIPFDTCLVAAELFEEKGGRVVFNLAPAADVDPRLLELSNPLVVNEFEAGLVLDSSAPDDEESAREAVESLLKKSRSVIVTLGHLGAVVGTRGVGDEKPIITYLPSVDQGEVVDTTGAGDAFVGVLAAELAKGRDLLSAADHANSAAGVTVTRSGASESYGLIKDLYLNS